uniref:Uncharacterized protein n=1 Tax=Opuntia streptacantha TaxID=393608 RepID=A0A7C9A3U3_OPUST
MSSCVLVVSYLIFIVFHLFADFCFNQILKLYVLLFVTWLLRVAVLLLSLGSSIYVSFKALKAFSLFLFLAVSRALLLGVFSMNNVSGVILSGGLSFCCKVLVACQLSLLI